MDADIRVENEGSIFVLRPLTETGEEWICENLASEPWQWLGNALCIEHRFAYEIVTGMKNDGLVVACARRIEAYGPWCDYCSGRCKDTDDCSFPDDCKAGK